MSRGRKPASRAPRSADKKAARKKFNKWFILAPALILGLAFVVTATVFFIPRDNTSFSFECWQLRCAVSGFLDDLCDGDFDSAARSVSFYSLDGSPVEATEEVRKAWSLRLQDLKTGVRNNYLADYSDLSVRKENGQMTVTAVLDVDLQGYPDPFYKDVRTIHVVMEEGEWKITGITDETLKTPFEQAVSGEIATDSGEN